jgi:1,4-alpha-glucan branching enzyme
MVSRPVHLGGLGFDVKWDMGWMHDTLQYFSHDPVHRKNNHSELTFRALYAFNENFVLPLSHDEVVHGKSSILSKMPGDEWQKFANLRLLYGYMYSQSGKKLLFMGSEFGQWDEWKHDGSVDWHLAQYDRHQGIQRLLAELNRLYREEPSLHDLDHEWAGFQWVESNDWEQSVLAYIRKGKNEDDSMLVVMNFTPIPRYNYRVGVPQKGRWREVFNSDATEFGGSGIGNLGGVESTPVPYHDQMRSILLTLPPLGAVFFKAEAGS